MNLPEISNSIMPWIGKTGKLIAVFIAETFKEHHFNLTIEQWVTLKVLHEEDGLMQNDLAFITSRNKTSLTRLIHTMEKYHLIARLQDTQDKRINRIFLTKYGSDVFQSTIPIMEKVKQQLQHDLSDEEVQVLICVLQKVQNNIKNNR